MTEPVFNTDNGKPVSSVTECEDKRYAPASPTVLNPTGIFKYNPHQMRAEDILATFVGREDLISCLLAHIRDQRGNKRPEHLFLFGPRGIGKTTMLLVLRHTIAGNPGLRNVFDIIQFNEEERRISNMPAFAVRILELLACHRQDAAKTLDEARKAPDRAMEILLETTGRMPEKQVLLLLDNFDEIAVAVTAKKTALSRGRGTQSKTTLESILKSPHFVIVATAIQSPQKRRNFPRSLLDHFAPPIKLEPITDAVVFLLKRAEQDRREGFSGSLPHFALRIEGLNRLAHGNPRLLVFLYDCLGHKPLLDLVEIVQKMVDDLTPMYQDVIDRLLNRGQAAVLEVLAAQGGVGSAGDLAAQSFQDEQTVRTFLADLCDLGLVVRMGEYKFSDQSARRTVPEIYRIDPPLFQIWYEMRHLNRADSLYLVHFFSLLSAPNEVRTLRGQLREAAAVAATTPLAKTLEEVADFLDPEWGEIWENYVLATLRKGENLRDSLQKLDAAILQMGGQYQHRGVGLRVAKIEVQLMLGDVKSATAELKEVEQRLLVPGEVETSIKFLVAKSRFLISTGETSKALETAKEAEDRCNNLAVATAHAMQATALLAQSFVYHGMGSYKTAIETAQQARNLLRGNEDEIKLIAKAELVIGHSKLSIGEYSEARACYERALKVYLEIDNRIGQASSLDNLGNVCAVLGEFEIAREYHEKSLKIQQEIGNYSGQASSLNNLGNVYTSMGNYERARGFYEKSASFYQESGDRIGQATSLGNIGNIYLSLCDYGSARECYEKSLAIQRETGDRNGQARSLGSLCIVKQLMGDYQQAGEYCEKSLEIQQEIEDRSGQAISLFNLGNICQFLGDYGHAREHYEKSLAIQQEIGDRNGQAGSLGNLGAVCHVLGDYGPAREFFEKAIAIQQEIGDRRGQADSLNNLGTVYQSLGDYRRAREHYEKSLTIKQEIGDRRGQANSLNNLGNIYQSLGDFERAREYCEKSLAIQQEIGNRRGQASSLNSLGTVYQSLGDYRHAWEHYERSLAIQQEIGDIRGQAVTLGCLGIVSASMGEYDNARDHLNKSLRIQQEIGDRNGQASSLQNLGVVYASQGDNARAQEYFEKALGLFSSLGERLRIQQAAFNLIGVFFSLAADAMRAGEIAKAEEFFSKALSFAHDAGPEEILSRFLSKLAVPCLQYPFDLANQRLLASRLLELLDSLASRIEAFRTDVSTISGSLRAARAILRFYARGESPAELKDLGPAEIFIVLSLRDRIERPLHVQARELIESRKLAEAAATLQSILDDSPGDVEALLLLSSIRMDDNRLDEAESLARRALSVQPELAPAVERLAEIERRRGNRSGAIRLLLDFVEKYPPQQTVYLPLLSDLRKEGRFEELASTLRKWRDIASDPQLRDSFRVWIPEAEILAGQVDRARVSMPPEDFRPGELSRLLLLGVLRVILDLQRKDADAARVHAADTLKVAVEGPPGRISNPLGPEMANRARKMLGDTEWEFLVRLAEAVAQQTDPLDFSREMLDEAQAQEFAKRFAEEENSALRLLKEGRIQGFRDLLRTTTRSIGPAAAIRAFGDHFSDYPERTRLLLMEIFTSAFEEGRPVEVTAALHAIGGNWPILEQETRGKSIKAMLSLSAKKEATSLNREQAIGLLNVLYPNMTDIERRQVKDELEKVYEKDASPGLVEFFNHTVPVIEKGEQKWKR